MIKRGHLIKTLFKNFYHHFSYLKYEEFVEAFCLFGGVEEGLKEYYIDDCLSFISTDFVENFDAFEALVSPSYLFESPYCELLQAVAQGDGKIQVVLNKAKLSASVGERLIEELHNLNVLEIEFSRETPLKVHPKQKLKREYRSYKIQDKLRFNHPFLRFWFGFVEPYKKALHSHKKERFTQNFKQHQERLTSLVYEQLCNDLLLQHFKDSSIVSSGSFWNIYTEFDILAVTKDKKIILGECKYKERKVCKNELTKLKSKAIESGLKVDMFVLFSKRGFSNELLQLKDKNLLLFDLEDLKVLLQ